MRGMRGLRGLTGLMWLLYIYCEMVRTPWEYAIWLYEASEQNVGVGDGVEWRGYPLARLL